MAWFSNQQSIRQRNWTDWAVASNTNFLPGKASSFSHAELTPIGLSCAMSSIPSTQGITPFLWGPPLSPSEDEIILPGQFYWVGWALRSQGGISESGLQVMLHNSFCCLGTKLLGQRRNSQTHTVQLVRMAHVNETARMLHSHDKYRAVLWFLCSASEVCPPFNKSVYLGLGG